jgi:hypothetical protein
MATNDTAVAACTAAATTTGQGIQTIVAWGITRAPALGGCRTATDLETWTDAAVAAGINLRQTDFSAAWQQVAGDTATGFPAGSPFGPSGFVVDCPVVTLDVNVSG